MLANFSLHKNEKVLLYFSECNSKVSFDEIILNTLPSDDFFANSKSREKHALLVVRYNYSVSLLHISY